MDQPEGPMTPKRPMSSYPATTRNITDYRSTHDRIISKCQATDAAGWLHRVLAYATAFDTNWTAIHYSVSKDGAARLDETIQLGHYGQTDYIKLDGVTVWAEGGDVCISPWGHGVSGNAEHTIVFPGVFRLWPDVAEGQQSFPDVPPDHVFYPFIERLYMAGHVHGRLDGLYHPEQDVTRGQVAAIVIGPIDE